MLPSPPVMMAAFPCRRSDGTMPPMLAWCPLPVLDASARRFIRSALPRAGQQRWLTR
jgi:hypothetical protein